jgi:hypothetical protein
MPVTINGSGTVTGVSADSLSTGLQHITTKSFTGVSSISVDNCFSSAFENYRIIGTIVGSGDTSISFRLRVSGADNSASSYNSIGYFVIINEGPTRIQSTSQTSARFGSANTTGYTNTLDIFGPHAVSATRFQSLVGGNLQTSQWGGSHEVVSSFTGFTVIPGAGTITGTLRVYGYMNGVAS